VIDQMGRRPFRVTTRPSILVGFCSGAGIGRAIIVIKPVMADVEV